MIGIVLVTYGHWPGKLIDSISSAAMDVRWYIHHHGHEPVLTRRIANLQARDDVNLILHNSNRGLSKSWNDGVHAAYQDGAEYALLANDDLYFIDGGFEKFIYFARQNDGLDIGYTLGLEIGQSDLAGQVVQQGLGCGIIARSAIKKIGYFDQNFYPAYYEDMDYDLRAVRSGLNRVTHTDYLVEHERSTTARSNPEIKTKLAEIMHLNRDYFERKWNIFDREPERFGNEIPYACPFNDNRYNYHISWNERNDPYPGYTQGLNDKSR